MLLALVFRIPVSIPGGSTVFGAAILLVGISRLIGRPLWLPARLRDKALPADRLRPGLTGGMTWVRRLERISRPHRLRALVAGRVQNLFNNLAFILAALLLMAPFGFVPFSNTLPALALLRSEEHTSELQSLMRISYAVFCLNKKTINTTE